jgi:AraC-like DNA-binding protein
MLPVFQKIEANIDHSFYVERVKFQYFPNPIHFHSEIEILLVMKGTGTRFVGDSVERFGPGNLVVIGQNVPHVWYSDEIYTKNNNLFSEVIFILFKTDIFGDRFWQLQEAKNILKVIQISQRGIKITGKTLDEVSLLMKSITTSVGFNRIILLLSILEKIAESKEFKLLSSSVVQNTISESDSERLNRVYQYVINNYQQDITLEKAAFIANLSATAFCRYFKKRSNKTFIQFLNEIRIAFACKLLVEEDHSVAAICFKCGFTNVSFFIRQFKRITSLTPLSYKKKYANIIPSKVSLYN